MQIRETGMHTFWVTSSDGAQLWLEGHPDPVVDNSGVHAEQTVQGTIFLEEGEEMILYVVYGNQNLGGILQVHWLDPLVSEPQASLMPILQPMRAL